MPDRNGALSGAYDADDAALTVTLVDGPSADTAGPSLDENGVWNAVYEDGSIRVVNA